MTNKKMINDKASAEKRCNESLDESLDEKSLQSSNESSVDKYAYILPPELIADKPLASRDQSRLLVLNKESGSIEHTRFDKLPAFLQRGDLLVVNDTKVIPAKIVARRKSGGFIKVLLIKPEPKQEGIWQAMVSPIKRLKPNEILTIDTARGDTHQIKIVDIITAADGFKRVLVYLGDGSKIFQILNEIGSAPLPPYIERDKPDPDLSEKSPDELLRAKSRASAERSFDIDRYQTIFATTPGAVAAPTAGLHFSESLLKELQMKGIAISRLTLHVGPGTFKPIEGDIEKHYIEPELFYISKETASEVNQAKREGRRVIAVGTTSLRALESAATANNSDQAITDVDGQATHLFVKPGYQFKVVDALITNFHLSRSSLLVLVATIAGHELIMRAYNEAIKERYRFYSYGDAMFITSDTKK